MHVLVVRFKLVVANEAIAFSVVLASDNGAWELGGIIAVLGVGVAEEVWPAL